MHDLGKGATPPSQWPSHHGHEARSVALAEEICQRLKIPNECRDLAVMTAREHGNVGRALELRANTIVSLLERCDAFRKPQRFLDMLAASECDHRGRTGFSEVSFPQAAYLQRALAAAQSVDAGAIAQKFLSQQQKIPEAIHAARVAAVSQAIGSTQP
jgi:tRNA nucleotidyltransferase (CCA-adding enzyme)